MLSRHGHEVSTVFDLFGHREVHLTAALGWTLSESPQLMALLLDYLEVVGDGGDAVVTLEESDSEGRTDIEVVVGSSKVVVEAKQGWLVPGEEQLSRYARRFDGFSHRLFVSMSDSSEQWAADQLPDYVDGVPVVHMPWDAVRDITRAAGRRAKSREAILLDELERYMGKATSTVPYDDQWVFCVVVSDSEIGGTSFQDYVRTERVYFHPFGGNNTWPKVPPNFLCFRWGGVVRQVNRVESFDIVPQLSDNWPAIDSEESAGPHIVYKLGPDIPIPEIKTKGTYATGRVWCLLDQLLVSTTLADAVRSSAAMRSEK